MTGIFGPCVLKQDSNEQIESMLKPLKEGVDAESRNGKIRNTTVGVHVAWLRRKYEPDCIEWNQSRDIGLLFIGEDFGAESARFEDGSSLTDAKRLLRLYESVGPNFVRAINGRFSGILFDLRVGTVALFNDRFGSDRLYIHEGREGFYFSNQAKSLLAVLPQLRAIDPRGLAEFFRVGCVLQNRSLFRDIQLLPQASWWTFRSDGSVTKDRYFEPGEWENQSPLPPNEYVEALVATFGQVAPRYLKGAAPAAISLTGGLDSRMILAWCKATGGTLPCYTFGGPYRECADVKIARRLAKIAGQPHQTLRLESDFYSNFLRLAESTVRATDGSMDVSGAIEIYMNQKARAVAPVRITGNYGSEILRLNIAFRPANFEAEFFTPEFQKELLAAGETYTREADCSRLSFIAFKQVPWHHYPRFAAERSQLTPRSPFLDNEIVKLAYRIPPALQGSSKPLLDLIARGNPTLDSVDSDRGLRATALPLLSKIKNSWQELTAKAEYAYDYGMPQWLVPVDHALSPLHLENIFLGRHKFYHFRIWYRNQLSAALREHLSAPPQSCCYSDGIPQKLVEEHIAGKANRTLQLHKMLSLKIIERELLAPQCRN